MPDDAVAILKDLQPPDGTLKEEEVNLISFINTMSNTDRHTKLPVFASGLDAVVLRWQMKDGTSILGGARADQGRFVENNAELGNIPDEAMNMEIGGVPRIIFPIADGKWHCRIPEDLDLAVTLLEKRIIPSLTPFVQPAK